MKAIIIYSAIAAVYAAVVGGILGKRTEAPIWKKVIGFAAAGLLWPANIIGLAWIAVRTAIWATRAIRRAAR